MLDFRSINKLEYISIDLTTAVITAFIFSIIIGLVLYLFNYQIIALFTDITILRNLTNELWALVVITPFISMLAFQLDGIFIGATLAKEMRNCIMFSSIAFYLIIEFFIQESLSLGV